MASGIYASGEYDLSSALLIVELVISYKSDGKFFEIVDCSCSLSMAQSTTRIKGCWREISTNKKCLTTLRR